MGLHEKMYKIMCEVPSLEKSMEVGSGNYKYNAISEAEVLNAVKPLLKQYKLILFPVNVDIIEYNDRKMSQVKATYKIVDTETGESELLATVGNGADSQDKGSGKALTYAYKALLQKTFCMFSGDDTDNTHSKDIEKQLEPEKTTVTQEQFNKLIVLSNKKGFDVKTLEKSLVKNFSHGMEFLTKSEYDKVYKQLDELPDKSL